MAALLTWQLWPTGKPTDTNAATGADANAPLSDLLTGTGNSEGSGSAGNTHVGGTLSPADANTAQLPPADVGAADANNSLTSLKDIPASTAMRLVQQGEQLLTQGKRVAGRAVLTKALFSGSLGEATASTVRTRLEKLADDMIFSRKISEADPYTASYVFQPGEVLARVERKLKLHVPTQILLKINGMKSGSQIRAGQRFKVIQGPFHAIVDKSDFTMDIFLQRDGYDPAFVRRLKVGLGTNGSTPVGLWRIRLGSKRDRSPWFPPPSAADQHSIKWGEPGYPLGKMGYWIGLEGIDQNTEMCEGFGIHGTNDPTSIGRAASLGCIRMADDDIELVFSLLYEHWSTVRVRK